MFVFQQVNATDADEGRDGTIEYEIDDEQDFTIDSSSGAITIKRKLNSHNARVLTVTAKSGVRSAQVFVTVEITGNGLSHCLVCADNFISDDT